MNIENCRKFMSRMFLTGESLQKQTTNNYKVFFAGLKKNSMQGFHIFLKRIQNLEDEQVTFYVQGMLHGLLLSEVSDSKEFEDFLSEMERLYEKKRK